MRFLHPSHFYIILFSSIAALGGFLFGYDTGIIAGALVFIRQSMPLSTLAQEYIVSAVVLGALVGSLCSGKLTDYFGCQRMLICMSLAFIIGTLCETFATSVPFLIFSRLIIGIAIGITSYVAPFFISELAPTKHRGALVLLNGVMITSGQMVAFLVSYLLISTESWRLIFFTGMLPAILFFIGVLLLPPSPRFMVLKGETEKARAILQKIRHQPAVSAELSAITHNILLTHGRWQELFSRSLLPVLVIGLGLGIFQQLMGINTVMYYGPIIFSHAGFQQHGAQLLATCSLGLVNLLMSIAAIFIVDKLGRRRLLLGGTLLAACSLVIVSWMFSHPVSWMTFIFLILYIAGYSVSLGSLFWLIIAEIYPLNIRGFAMSFVTAIQWGTNFIVALTFLSTLEKWGAVFTFSSYGLMCGLSFLFCYYFVPETRGLSLEHIEYTVRQGNLPQKMDEHELDIPNFCRK